MPSCRRDYACLTNPGIGGSSAFSSAVSGNVSTGRQHRDQGFRAVRRRAAHPGHPGWGSNPPSRAAAALRWSRHGGRADAGTVLSGAFQSGFRRRGRSPSGPRESAGGRRQRWGAGRDRTHPRACRAAAFGRALGSGISGTSGKGIRSSSCAMPTVPSWMPLRSIRPVTHGSRAGAYARPTGRMLTCFRAAARCNSSSRNCGRTTRLEVAADGCGRRVSRPPAGLPMPAWRVCFRMRP